MEIKNGRKSILRGKKLSDSLSRYAETVTVTKKTAVNETNRIRRLQKSWLAAILLEDLNNDHIQRWIDEEC